MGDTFLNNAKHWRDRAEETRTKAEQCWTNEAKQRLLRVANEYDRLADHAANRAAEGVQSNRNSASPA